MISCPKCGHVQEDRADCLKCGIVFAKFYALHAGEQSLPPDPVAFHNYPQAAPEEISPAEFALMRQTVRDLERRFNELEFERVERGRLRSDLRELDRKLQEKLDEVSAVQAAQESKVELLAQRPLGPSAADFDELSRKIRAEDMQDLQDRQAQLELRLAKMERQGLSTLDGSRLMEVIADHARQLAGLETRLEGVAAAAVPPREEGLNGQMAEELEKLRTSLQAVSLRYSEIGELKKNNLVVEDKLDTLREALNACRAENQQNSKARIEDLGKEVAALKAEVRHAIDRLSAVEAPFVDTALEASPLRSDLDALSRLRAEDAERFRRELASVSEQFEAIGRSQAGFQARLESLAGLMARFERSSNSMEQRIELLTHSAAAIPERIAEVGHQSSNLQDELQKILARMDQVEALLAEPAAGAMFTAAMKTPPAMDDMALIRQNLADIRMFMEGLSRKP